MIEHTIRTDIKPITQGMALDLFCSGVTVLFIDSATGLITQPFTLDGLLSEVHKGYRDHWYRVSDYELDNIATTGKHSGDIRAFTQLSKAWYGPANLTDPRVLDRVNIGFYSPDGGTSGEFVIEWEKLAGKWTPRLSAYDDSWSALFNFQDVLKVMSEIDDQDVSPDYFCDKLENLGIKNETPKKVD